MLPQSLLYASLIFMGPNLQKYASEFCFFLIIYYQLNVQSCKMIPEKISVALWNVHILQSESKTFSWRFAHMSYV